MPLCSSLSLRPTTQPEKGYPLGEPLTEPLAALSPAVSLWGIEGLVTGWQVESSGWLGDTVWSLCTPHIFSCLASLLYTSLLAHDFAAVMEAFFPSPWEPETPLCSCAPTRAPQSLTPALRAVFSQVSTGIGRGAGEPGGKLTLCRSPGLRFGAGEGATCAQQPLVTPGLI